VSSSTTSFPVENRLLAALLRDEYERLLPNLELVRFPRNRILYEAGDEVRSAYFLNDGLVSLLAITEAGQTVATFFTIGRSVIRSNGHLVGSSSVFEETR
jgi:CRP-like cAMP-binding protein